MAAPEMLAAITRASEQSRAAIASLGVAFSDLGAAMSSFGSIGASGIQRMIEIEEQAMRLSTLTPLVPEDARALILEHGIGVAEEVSRYVAMGFSINAALERVQSGVFINANSFEGGITEFRSGTVYGRGFGSFRRVVQEVPIGIDEDGNIETREIVGYSGFDVSGQPQSPNPCQSCANYVGGKYRSDDGDRHPTLICGIHPYGPDGDDCPDWESTKTPEAQRRSEEAKERSRNAEREAALHWQGWRRPSARDVFWDEVEEAEQDLPRVDLTGLVDIVPVNGELQIEPRRYFDPAFMRWPSRILVRHESPIGNNYIVEFPQCVWNYAEQRIETLTPRGWRHSWRMTVAG